MSSSSSRQSPRRAVNASVEHLEPRTLLSATLTAKGTLIADGTAGADVIVISRDPRRASKIRVLINGVSAKFPSISVKRIEMYGEAGNDNMTLDDSLGVISARGASLYGQAGNDTLVGGLSGATFDGGTNDDSIVGSAGNDVIVGNAGNDTLTGGAGNDRIFGTDGNDLIHGSGGNDMLYGEAGGDTVFGDNGNDTIGGDGEDRMQFKGFGPPAAIQGNDSLVGGNGDDWITGGDESASLHDQNNGTDTITGGAGNDILDARGWAANVDDVITDRQAGDIVPMEDHTRVATPAELALGEDAYFVHKHAELIIKIMDNGVLKQIAIPAGTGDFVSPTLDNTSPAFHTHPNQEGILHMHDLVAHTFTLGEFFRNWGVTIDATHIGRYVAGNGHTLTITVRHAHGANPVVLTDPYNYVIQGNENYNLGDLIEFTYV